MSEVNGTGSRAYDALRAELKEIEILSSVAALLGWDQEVMMPPSGTSLRASQSALLSQSVHERRTSDKFRDLLEKSEQDQSLASDDEAAANLREIRRSFDHAVKIPTSLVREFAETTTHAQHAWKDARANSEFSTFQPWLEKIIELTKARAECLSTSETADLYDPLLDEYEPGAKTADIVEVFRDLRGRLTPLIKEIAGASHRPGDEILSVTLPIPDQTAFNAKIAGLVGFDFEAGRLDTSTHPFCQSIGFGDTRLTTRYRVDAFFDALSSTLHETGHGLYEQGLPKDKYLGEPLSEAVSLGIHESQSRMWENLVGRSRPFWEWALPEAKNAFGGALNHFDVDAVYGAMNSVEPNLIRVDSDEATYNLHIMLRFDLERAMLSGDLKVADLPGAWNERIRADLGLEVPDDRRGCLQDVHWSIAAIGYFPTYTLGNLYAAQFWVKIREDIPQLEEQIARGEFGQLLSWLRREIHEKGRRYTAPQLCQSVTGKPPSALPFMSYLEGKLRPLYRL